jgi:hypothetical protein
VGRRLVPVSLADRLAATTRQFLDLLDGDQRTAATLDFDQQERRAWVYWPTGRRGVALHRLGRRGTKAAHRMLATAVPVAAFARAVTIMGLDEVLDRLENYTGDRRHRDDYWVTIFGSPGDHSWGWRFEGHHVSVHATVVDGQVGLTPLFLGANTAVVHDGGRVAVAPLAPEEELGFDLLHALKSGERSAVTIADTAPADIVTRNDPRIDASLATTGLPLISLQGAAASAARALLDVYLARFPDGARTPDPREARFAWAGADQPGLGHYYRIAGPRLLVELDNTQDGANHVHTVVRDPEADFGDDLLAAHHRQAHGGGVEPDTPADPAPL